MAAAVPFIISALKAAALGAAVSAGTTAIRGGNVGRAAGRGALGGLGGGVGGMLGGTLGAGLGGAAGTYAGGAASSQRVTPLQAAMGGVTSAIGHKMLTPAKPRPVDISSLPFAGGAGASRVSPGISGAVPTQMLQPPRADSTFTLAQAPTQAPATDGFFGNLQTDIGNIFKDKSLMDVLPLVMGTGGLAGTPAPTMPTYPQFEELKTGELGQERQAALAELQALQYEDYLKRIKPVAAQQGWLDSSYYANLLSDFQQKQAALGTMEQSAYDRSLIPYQANALGGQYQQQLGQYNLEYQQREELKKQLMQQLYGFVTP